MSKDTLVIEEKEVNIPKNACLGSNNIKIMKDTCSRNFPKPCLFKEVSPLSI